MNLYRYYGQKILSFTLGGLKTYKYNIILEEYNVVKETEHTYLISDGMFQKRVFKNAKKKYAEDSKQKALEAFLKRTIMRQKFLLRDVGHAENIIKLIKKEMER